MALLTVSDLHAYYGDTAALRGVSLTVEPGEIVALLGSNGAGKTTTLRTITGLQRARRGRVVFDGADITRSKAHSIVEMGIGHVPEGRRIFASLTVEENLRLGGYLSRRNPKTVAARREEVFELFPRLVERRQQLGGTLSGGEQQMLAIGRAMMNEPRLLALDEPSMGLAPKILKTVFEAITAMNDAGTTILLVEQNARAGLRLAGHGVVMENGLVRLSGTGREVLEHPEIGALYLGGSSRDGPRAELLVGVTRRRYSSATIEPTRPARPGSRLVSTVA